MPIVGSKWYSPFENGWKLCNYHTKGNGYDDLSLSLHHFKENDKTTVDAFTKWSLSGLKNVLPELEIDYCIRALGRSELTATTTTKPLHKLAESIASKFDIEYIPELIAKTKTTRHLVKLNKAQREAELKDVFYLNMKTNLKGKSVLLVDDIKTSGTTAKYIRKVLVERFPDVKCYLFVLGESNASANSEDVIDRYNKFFK